MAVESSPDLQVTLEHSIDDCRELEATDVDELKRKTAALFKIPVQQVHYTET